MRVIIAAKPNTLWAGAESLNNVVGRGMETAFESRPMVRPAPDRQARLDHRPRLKSASLTYLNGCKAKHERSIKRCVG